MTKKAPHIPQNIEEVMADAVENLLRLPQDLKEAAIRFENEDIENSIVFFGSARTLPEDQAQEQLDKLLANPKANDPSYDSALELAKNNRYMSRFYRDSEELAYKLTTWALSLPKDQKHFLLCSGGGPGIMEAANKGAHRAGGRSIGLSIIIPREQASNKFITPELDFSFDTFLLRKFWFFYFMKAIVVFPGGVGTLDELFEVLTLIVTKKLPQAMPLVLFGSEYWKSVINFETLIKYGSVKREEINTFIYSDDVEETFNYITKHLTELYLK